MKEMNIKEFAKENKYMTQMSKDVDMDAALSALATLSANVEAISESDALKELVHSIPVGYSVYNPVVKFTKRAKNGRYDNLSDEEYQERLDEVEVQSKLWEDKPETDLLTLYFNATAEMPMNSMRRLVSNANNALRSMSGAEKMMSSVYGIAITAMV